MKQIVIDLHDVLEDGFPDDGACFLYDGDVYTGWPLIDTDGTYKDQPMFSSPEKAREHPMSVYWEASEDRVSGEFIKVRYWFYRARLNPDPTPAQEAMI